MGTGNRQGASFIRTESEDPVTEPEPFSVLVVPDGLVEHGGANEAHLLIPTTADIEAIVYAILAGLSGSGNILLESGDNLLIELGDKLLLE